MPNRHVVLDPAGTVLYGPAPLIDCYAWQTIPQNHRPGATVRPAPESLTPGAE